MKTALFFAALATSAFAESPVPVLVHPSPEAVARYEAMCAQQQPSPSVENEAIAFDLSTLGNSLVLNDGKNWTIVPTGAVIFLPNAAKSHLARKPVGKLLNFTEFLKANSTWITTHEVSFEQAAGTETLPAERVSCWANQNKLVIAVHQNSPKAIQMTTETQALTQR